MPYSEQGVQYVLDWWLTPCNQVGMQISNKSRYHEFLQKLKAVRTARERDFMAALGWNSNTLRWNSLVKESRTRASIDWQSNCSSSWSSSLRGDKAWALKHNKALSFWIGNCFYPTLRAGVRYIRTSISAKKTAVLCCLTNALAHPPIALESCWMAQKNRPV